MGEITGFFIGAHVLHVIEWSLFQGANFLLAIVARGDKYAIADAS